MDFDPERVRENARQSTTEDLLDRVTVFREGMEPDGLAIIEAELRGRGIGPREVDEHAARRREGNLLYRGGYPAVCSFCERPAVEERWRWAFGRGRWGLFPVFRPRHYYYCAEHRPENAGRRELEGAG